MMGSPARCVPKPLHHRCLIGSPAHMRLMPEPLHDRCLMGSPAHMRLMPKPLHKMRLLPKPLHHRRLMAKPLHQDSTAPMVEIGGAMMIPLRQEEAHCRRTVRVRARMLSEPAALQLGLMRRSKSLQFCVSSSVKCSGRWTLPCVLSHKVLQYSCSSAIFLDVMTSNIV